MDLEISLKTRRLSLLEGLTDGARALAGRQLASFSLNLSSLSRKRSPLLCYCPRKPRSEPSSSACSLIR